MLPETLAGSYQQYKEDTSAFTTWLFQAAKTCGWKPAGKLERQTVQTPTQAPPKKAPRLKGKERKLAKETAKDAQSKSVDGESNPQPTVRWTVTTGDLQNQIDTVVEWEGGEQEKPVRMPPRIQRVLSRAIAVRKRFATWFERTDTQNRYANETHQYFIGLLQRAADVLSGPSNQRAKTASSSKSNNDFEGDVLRNYFSALHIHQPDQDEEHDDDDVSAADIISPAAGSFSKLADHDTVYEVSEDERTELLLRVFCFFEDLHTVQGQLRRVWKKYAAGELHIIFATIITTAAIALVGRAEKALLELYPTMESEGGSYQCFVPILLYTESIQGGDRLPSSFALDGDIDFSPFKEFMYLPTGITAFKITHLQKFFVQRRYPTPVTPMSCSYITRPELLRDSARMRKFEAEDRILVQLVQDQAGFYTWRGPAKKTRVVPMFDDIITATLKPLWQDGKVSTQSVFAARILLDILDILGPEFSGERLLSDHADYAQDLFQLGVNDKAEIVVRDDVKWAVTDQPVLTQIQHRLTVHMPGSIWSGEKEKSLTYNKTKRPEADRDLFKQMITPFLKDVKPSLQEQYIANAQKLDVKPIWPNEDPHFIVNANPLHCGTMILNVCALTEESGIGLVNHNWSVLGVAHLYNALRQLKLTDVSWPEMDHIIEFQRGPLFAGEIPSTPEAMESRVLYRFGMRGPEAQFIKKLPFRLQSSPVTKTLLQFFDADATIDRTFYELEEHVHNEELALTTSSSSSSTTSQQRQRRAGRKQLTPPQFIAKLEKYLPLVLRPMTIDYINLTRTCDHLLHTIRTTIHGETGIDSLSISGGGYSNPNSNLNSTSTSTQDYSLIGMVAWLLSQNKVEAEKWAQTRRGNSREQKTKPSFDGGKHLKIARDTFERIWKEEIPQERKTGLSGAADLT